MEYVYIYIYIILYYIILYYIILYYIYTHILDWNQQEMVHEYIKYEKLWVKVPVKYPSPQSFPMGGFNDQ